MRRTSGLRMTKVVATLGPACDRPETLESLVDAGMNVARLNLSHGSPDEHAARIEHVRAAARRRGAHVAIMVDTKGLEVRTAAAVDEAVALLSGELFDLHVDGRPSTRRSTSVTHLALPREVKPGSVVLVDDGRIELRVLETQAERVRCRVERGGPLGSRKTLHVPGAALSLDLLNDENRDDLSFAASHEVDYVAASFVRSAEDVKRLRDYLHGLGAEIPIIAKIEHPEAVANLEEIVAVADGTMVARGDLGATLPVGEVPMIQKRVIRATVLAGKPAITATQMLDSMERNDRPTRAEASDVANAIFDGTSAVMLSGETARGLHPVETVRTIDDLARRAERELRQYGDLQRLMPVPTTVVTDAVAQAAVTLARHLEAAAILTLTESGSTSRAISKYRPRCPNLALTSSPRVLHRLALNWGVTPILFDAHPDDDDARIVYGIDRARQMGVLEPGDTVVATAGISREVGSTNLIRVLCVE